MKKLILIGTLALTGCALFTPIKYTGDSITDAKFKTSTEEAIEAWFGYCISEIHTKIDSLKFNQDQTRIIFAKEFWTVKGCNKVKKFEVTFTTNDYGTNISVTPARD